MSDHFDDLGNLLRGERRGRFVRALLAAAFAGAVCWYFGLDGIGSLTITVASAAVGLAWVAVPEHRLADWPEAEPGTERAGARQDIVELSWALLPRYGRVRPVALRRVRDLARYRLALRQLDLADPGHRSEIERLIGPAAYATLQTPGRRPPLLRSVVHCLDMLDRLDPARAAPPQELSRHRIRDSLIRRGIRYDR